MLKANSVTRFKKYVTLIYFIVKYGTVSEFYGQLSFLVIVSSLFDTTRL